MPHPFGEFDLMRSLVPDHAPGPAPGDGHHGYDPDQPRVPAGEPRGGQWTSKPGGAGSSRHPVTVDRTGNMFTAPRSKAWSGRGTKER